jgi:hypothetical protein
MIFTRLTRLTQACAVFALALAVGFVAAPQAARAGDENSSTDFYKATFGKLLNSFGLKSADDDDEIHYRERAPLVLPPDSKLPPPEKASAVPNPAWPKDPDVTRAKQIKKMEANRNVDEERQRDENPLRPDQLAPGPRPRGVAARDNGTSADPYSSNVLSPSELGFKGSLFETMFGGGKDNGYAAKFTGEPPRTSLIEPPPGYQTPSPDQPYGSTTAPAPKADDNYVTRAEPVK